MVAARKLKSARIKAAPALDMVLTRATPRTDAPPIPSPPAHFARAGLVAVPADTPLNSIQKAVIAASVTRHRGAAPGNPAILQEVSERVNTHADALNFVQEVL